MDEFGHGVRPHELAGAQELSPGYFDCTVRQVRLDDEDGLEAIFRLRATVWESQLGARIFEDGRWEDEHDAHAIHWGAFTPRNRLIGTARLCMHASIAKYPHYDEIDTQLDSLPGPVAMMTRLAVHPDFQRRGIARRIDDLRLERAAALGASSVLLQVPGYRQKSMETLGFTYMGKARDHAFSGGHTLPFHIYTLLLKARFDSPGGRTYREPLCRHD